MTELLGGFAGMVRAHALKKLEAQTALLALLTFVLICATWVDAFNMSQGITLDFDDLWAPILLATFYYLAAAIVFPRDPEQFAHLHAYFAARRKFVIGLLIAAEVVDHVANLSWYGNEIAAHAGHFWAWVVPYNIMIDTCFVALFFARGRRANIILLSMLILLFMVPYWHEGAVDVLAMRLFGYS